MVTEKFQYIIGFVFQNHIKKVNSNHSLEVPVPFSSFISIIITTTTSSSRINGETLSKLNFPFGLVIPPVSPQQFHDKLIADMIKSKLSNWEDKTSTYPHISLQNN